MIFFSTSDSQFGFKKVLAAIFLLKRFVILLMVYMINQGSAVNLCAIDLSKAFDKVNRANFTETYAEIYAQRTVRDT